MTTSIEPTATTEQQDASFGALYAEVQQFYAQHMQLLDSGEAEQWAAQFTEEASFDVPTLPEPVRGRDSLTAAVRRTGAQLAAAAEQHRHWQGMIDVRPQPDGTVRTRAYTLVLATVRGGDSRLHRVCVCEDVLVREHGRPLVSARKVTRDDLA